MIKKFIFSSFDHYSLIIMFKIYLNFLVCFFHYLDLEEPEPIQESEEKVSSIETIEEDSIDS